MCERNLRTLDVYLIRRYAHMLSWEYGVGVEGVGVPSLQWPMVFAQQPSRSSSIRIVCARSHSLRAYLNKIVELMNVCISRWQILSRQIKLIFENMYMARNVLELCAACDYDWNRCTHQLRPAVCNDCVCAPTISRRLIKLQLNPWWDMHIWKRVIFFKFNYV